MGRRYYYFALFYLIEDLFWCNIPYNCRDCIYLKECRQGFFKGRKCKNGCIKLNNRRRFVAKKYYDDLREDAFNALIDEANKREQKEEAKKGLVDNTSNQIEK